MRNKFRKDKQRFLHLPCSEGKVGVKNIGEGGIQEIHLAVLVVRPEVVCKIAL